MIVRLFSLDIHQAAIRNQRSAIQRSRRPFDDIDILDISRIEPAVIKTCHAVHQSRLGRKSTHRIILCTVTATGGALPKTGDAGGIGQYAFKIRGNLVF